MSDKTKRTFTATEVTELVEIMRDSPEITAEKYSGMEYLAELLRYLETKTDDDIETEARAAYRALSRN